MPLLTVLDASESVAGQFCAKLLADGGAQVVLAEPPGGSVLRARPALFTYLNAGKRPASEAGTALHRYDVAVLSDQPPLPTDLPAGLIVCRIHEFGDGPRSSWRGSELVHQALCGLAYTTGEANRSPLYGFGSRAYYSAGAAAHASILAAVLERQHSGLGQVVEVTVAETTASMNMNMVAQYEYNGTWPRRSQYPGPLATLRCADGWIVVFVTPGRWPGVCDAFGMPALRDDPRFGTGAALIANWTAATAAMADAVREQPKALLVRRGQAERFAIAAVADLAEVLEEMEPTERVRWESLQAPEPPAPQLEPPQLEQSAPGARLEGGHRGASPPRPAPLHGLRVLELTTAWAGPMIGRSLAYLGAEVIKVESRANVDAWRGPLAGGDPRRYPDLRLGERPYNRSATFNSQNTDKRSVELDLKSGPGLAAMRALVARSDVLVCNIAPGSLERLGLGYDALRALAPGIVVIEISGFGGTGPTSRQVAIGPTIEASSGMMTLVGYGDGVPQNTGGAYLDPVAALVGTGQVLAALVDRERSGAGRHIQLSLRELALMWMGEYIVELIQTGATPGAIGNGAPEAAPHGVYPTTGEDEWLAMAVFDDAQWDGLCSVMGRADLRAEPALSTHDGRWRDRIRLDAEIARWCAGQDRHAAADRLQAAGVPAAALYHGGDLARDAHLAARGFFHELTHAETGTHRYPGLPYGLLGSPGACRTAAPCLGQDNEFLAELLRGH